MATVLNKVKPIYTSWKGQMVYASILPLFFLGFVVLYRPEHVVELLSKGNGLFGLNITILSCIILGVMLISRTMQYTLHKQMQFNYFKFLIWQVAEVVVMSLFMSLYLTLICKGQVSYYTMFGNCLLYSFAVLIFPYIIIALGLWVLASEQDDSAFDDTLMRFVDSANKVKLMIAASSVLYIEAKENSVVIKYLDGDTMKDYTLRSSMTALEGLATRNGLVRCQRSYYVNPTHVKVLRRDKEGIMIAELNVVGCKSIPVSPRYYETLASKL